LFSQFFDTDNPVVENEINKISFSGSIKSSGFSEDNLMKGDTSISTEQKFVILSKSNIVSSINEFYVMSKGAAHPNRFVETTNYDLKIKKVVKLQDLFASNAVMSEKIKASLAKYEKMSLLFPDWRNMIDKKIDKAQFQFVFVDVENSTRPSIKMTFAPYDIGPYASGIIESENIELEI
jgi:hypothetical protein